VRVQNKMLSLPNSAVHYFVIGHFLVFVTSLLSALGY
jgi:hypothetical protein